MTITCSFGCRCKCYVTEIYYHYDKCSQQQEKHQSFVPWPACLSALFVLLPSISLTEALFSWQLAVSPHPIVLNCCRRRSTAFNKINTSLTARNKTQKLILIPTLWHFKFNPFSIFLSSSFLLFIVSATQLLRIIDHVLVSSPPVEAPICM